MCCPHSRAAGETMSPLFRQRGALIIPILALFVAVGSSARATDAPLLPARPSLPAACAAWREHISGLLDQHRIAHDIDDDALYDFVLQFIDARDACSLGSYEIGLRMYEAIALGRARGVLK